MEIYKAQIKKNRQIFPIMITREGDDFVGRRNNTREGRLRLTIIIFIDN